MINKTFYESASYKDFLFLLGDRNFIRKKKIKSFLHTAPLKIWTGVDKTVLKSLEGCSMGTFPHMAK